ncbi:hypothetical protein DERF_004296 [Dermatophagoides farinae]|uniref:Uncharacterized protein n=1 Tax=Dermatophagoides farinae TaxID=6954 RepID=A0A922I1M8_DERFA|nr:hypothetical protein DERF_004296 [Dermatophagoides farinae]
MKLIKFLFVFALDSILVQRSNKKKDSKQNHTKQELNKIFIIFKILVDSVNQCNGDDNKQQQQQQPYGEQNSSDNCFEMKLNE